MKRSVTAHADHVDPQQAEADALALTAQVWGGLPYTVKEVYTRLMSSGPWRVSIDSFHDEDEA